MNWPYSITLVFREVCRASTKEWAINKFLYNYTDAAALQIVAKVLGQRALHVHIRKQNWRCLTLGFWGLILTALFPNPDRPAFRRSSWR